MLAFAFRKSDARIVVLASASVNTKEPMTATRGWSFLTIDALVLIHVIERPRSTLRSIADSVHISDRATLSILRALEADAIVSRRKEGRRNVYSVDLDALRAHRGAGPYTLEELANALLILSRREPGLALPMPMRDHTPLSEPALR